jgi:hypothetical protein
MTNLVYVVLGEQGEYSDRSVWVSGVFTSEETAKEFMKERMAISRKWQNWNSKYRSLLFNLQNKFEKDTGNYSWKIDGMTHKLQSQAREEIEKLWGPEPEVEAAEGCSLFAVPLNEWVSLNSIFEENS